MKKSVWAILLLLGLSACRSTGSAGERDATNDPDSLTGKNTYVNPVDGKEYSTEGEFVEYIPEGGVKEQEGRVRSGGIILLTSESELSNMISVEELADFIKEVDALIVQELAEVEEQGKLVIQFTLHSEQASVISMGYEGELNEDELGTLFTQVEAFTQPFQVRQDSAVFQSVYYLNED